MWSPAIPKVQEPALSQPGTIPAFVAPPGLVLQSQAQDCGFVFGGFKAATSSGGFQAKVLPTATNEGGNAMPKDFPGVIFFFFLNMICQRFLNRSQYGANQVLMELFQ